MLEFMSDHPVWVTIWLLIIGFFSAIIVALITEYRIDRDVADFHEMRDAHNNGSKIHPINETPTTRGGCHE